MPYEPIHSLKGFLLVFERQGKLGDDNPTVGGRNWFVGKMFMEPELPRVWQVRCSSQFRAAQEKEGTVSG